MRLIVGCALALCGCNQIYGLEKTRARDAPGEVFVPVKLSLLVAPANDGAQAPTTLAPIPDAKPRVATLDGAFADAAYDDRSVLYTSTLVGTTWRLEYTPPGDVPHELQWSPPEGAGNVVVPMFGPTDRTKVAANTGYQVDLLVSGAPYTFSPDAVIYTTGYWTRTPVPSSTATPAVDFALTPPLSGAFGAPSAAARDRIVAFDYANQDDCHYALQAGTAIVPAIENGTQKPVTLTRDTSQSTAAFTFATPFADTASTLHKALGGNELTSRSTNDASGSTLYLARVPHTNVPQFQATIAGVPAPVMIPLAECAASNPSPAFTISDGTSLLSFTKMMYAFISNDRTVGATRLRSSLAGVGPLKSGQSTYEVDLGVQLATDPKLGEIELATTDGVLIGPDPVDLTFNLSGDPGATLDYFEVVLARIGGATPEPVRVYVIPTPTTRSVRIDPKVMLPNEEYVLAIRTYRGAPQAKNFDFQPVEVQQAVGTIYTRTFKLRP